MAILAWVGGLSPHIFGVTRNSFQVFIVYSYKTQLLFRNFCSHPSLFPNSISQETCTHPFLHHDVSKAWLPGTALSKRILKIDQFCEQAFCLIAFFFWVSLCFWNICMSGKAGPRSTSKQHSHIFENITVAGSIVMIVECPVCKWQRKIFLPLYIFYTLFSPCQCSGQCSNLVFASQWQGLLSTEGIT